MDFLSQLFLEIDLAFGECMCRVPTLPSKMIKEKYEYSREIHEMFMRHKLFTPSLSVVYVNLHRDSSPSHPLFLSHPIDDIEIRFYIVCEP